MEEETFECMLVSQRCQVRRAQGEGANTSTTIFSVRPCDGQVDGLVSTHQCLAARLLNSSKFPLEQTPWKKEKMSQ